MRYLLSLFVATLVFVYGVMVGIYQIFPFDQLRYTKQLIIGSQTGLSWLENRCSRHIKRHEFFSQISDVGNANNIFFGDSVVEGMWSENFFELEYSKMASGGNVVECLEVIGADLLALNPQNIIIYLGGNDADGQGRQTVSEVSSTFQKFINELHSINANVVIHGIHRRGYPGKRDQNYADELNDALRNIAAETNSHFIEPFHLFESKQSNFEELTYDGEHLKAKAYLQWLKYINENLPESFPNFLRERK